ncbi:MAG: helix-turn-helix domain-containing protein [Saccharolobus sp.]
MRVYKLNLKLKHDSCWTYMTTDFKVTAEIKYLFPLVAKNSVFEIAELYSDNKSELTDFIYSINRRHKENIKVVNVDRQKASKSALLYYFKHFSNSVTSIMLKNNVLITRLTISNGIEDWNIYFFGDKEEILSNFIEELKQVNTKVEDISVDRAKLDDMKKELILLNSLTPTERQMLYTAVKLGFFEYPKKIKLEELASLFGVTKVTLDRHLRNGIKKILTQLFILKE